MSSPHQGSGLELEFPIQLPLKRPEHYCFFFLVYTARISVLCGVKLLFV